ncbi:MAG: hypothetical protein HY353_01940 [Candidatus Omnitrophica bacterium]|nr:hypothetical protein [Candidatus Omnitrophota bacterium]
MDLKRWLLATAGAFAVILLGDTVIHHMWLGDFYRANAQWWRPATEMEAMRGLMFVSQALLAALLTFIYMKGYEPGKGSLGQGFRFGVLMGLLLAVPSSLMHLVVYPYPAALVLSWLVGTLLEVTLAGIMIGYIYKPSA